MLVSGDRGFRTAFQTSHLSHVGLTRLGQLQIQIHYNDDMYDTGMFFFMTDIQRVAKITKNTNVYFLVGMLMINH